jgi:hypothetical protein
MSNIYKLDEVHVLIKAENVPMALQALRAWAERVVKNVCSQIATKYERALSIVEDECFLTAVAAIDGWYAEFEEDGSIKNPFIQESSSSDLNHGWLDSMHEYIEIGSFIQIRSASILPHRYYWKDGKESQYMEPVCPEME